jgi:hypothetical protein
MQYIRQTASRDFASELSWKDWLGSRPLIELTVHTAQEWVELLLRSTRVRIKPERLVRLRLSSG